MRGKQLCLSTKGRRDEEWYVVFISQQTHFGRSNLPYYKNGSGREINVAPSPLSGAISPTPIALLTRSR